MSFKWLEEAKIASWWLEWSDLEWPCGELEKRWKKRAKKFVDLGVNTVVIFGFHFRWDYIPILDRTIEILARISEICHDEGLRFVDYHSATLIHRPRHIEDRWDIKTRNRHHVPFYPDDTDDLSFAGSKINDWRQISAITGKPEYYPGYTCEMLCPNNPGFQSAYLRLVQLHLEKINTDPNKAPILLRYVLPKPFIKIPL